MSKKFIPALFAALALTSLASMSAHAQGSHPAYLHAMTDLRDARWNLEQRGGAGPGSGQQDVAIVEIDRAVAEARRAAMWDGKDIGDHPQEDAHGTNAGHMHRAVELLRKAHDDIAQPEDNPGTREIRDRVSMHIDLALQAATRAIHEIEQSQ